jgi:hypothetical protein
MPQRTRQDIKRRVLGGIGIMAIAALTLDARQTDADIAAAIVIGQAHASGHIVVAGFVDDAARRWPQTITVGRLIAPGAGNVGADFIRLLAREHPDSFAAGERIDPEHNLFAAADGVSGNRPLALYRSRVTIAESTRVFGWSGTLGLRDISYQNSGQLRPISSRERDEIERERRRQRRDVKCASTPQWIDTAKILLTASIASSRTTIRLSSYRNPGCLNQPSTIYVLDTMTAGRQPQRFEFRHYHGLH